MVEGFIKLPEESDIVFGISSDGAMIRSGFAFSRGRCLVTAAFDLCVKGST